MILFNYKVESDITTVVSKINIQITEIGLEKDKKKVNEEDIRH